MKCSEQGCRKKSVLFIISESITQASLYRKWAPRAKDEDYSTQHFCQAGKFQMNIVTAESFQRTRRVITIKRIVYSGQELQKAPATSTVTQMSDIDGVGNCENLEGRFSFDTVHLSHVRMWTQ